MLLGECSASSSDGDDEQLVQLESWWLPLTDGLFYGVEPGESTDFLQFGMLRARLRTGEDEAWRELDLRGARLRARPPPTSLTFSLADVSQC